MAAGRAPALGAAAALVATALAGVLAVTVMVGGPVDMVLADPDGQARAGLVVDHVGAVVLLLVCTVSAVVQAFARRYLHGDPAAARFAVAAGH